MRWSDIFLGPLLHWLVWLVLIVVLAWLGLHKIHARFFEPFIIGIVLLAASAIAVLLLTYRPGERVTREPFDDG